MKQKLLDQSIAVRTNVLPEVKKVCDTVKPDYDKVEQYKTDIVQWLKPVINLQGYSVYPMNGCTEGLNWWHLQETRGITVNKGEYQWISPCNGNGEMQYISVPSAIDGNFKLLPADMPIALDLAYVGSSKVTRIEYSPNIEFVFYSLSKAFGVRNIRTGWLFTKYPDKKLESLIHNAKYYNYYAHEVAEKIINNFDIDYVHNNLCHLQYKICNAMDFSPSDSVWLATTKNKDYTKFMRDGKKARICLSGVYNEEE